MFNQKIRCLIFNIQKLKKLFAMKNIILQIAKKIMQKC